MAIRGGAGRTVTLWSDQGLRQGSVRGCQAGDAVVERITETYNETGGADDKNTVNHYYAELRMGQRPGWARRETSKKGRSRVPSQCLR